MKLLELQSRHSIRSYTGECIERSIVDKIKAEIRFINTIEAGLHFQLIECDSSPFDGISNSYGLFKNVKNYIACVIEPSYPNTYQRAGYYAQQLVTLIVSLGLGMCYVGGTYNQDNVKAQMRAGEKLPFIIAIGYPNIASETFVARIGRKLLHLNKRDLRDFIDADIDINIIRTDFPLLYNGIKAIACAPSSMNKQPVKLIYRDNRISAITKTNSNSDLIDLGIALYNFQYVYPGFWDWGNPANFIAEE